MNKEKEKNQDQDSWNCSSCGKFTKPDEWHDYKRKRCIDCGAEE
jgi:hypothetical protein